MPRLTAEKKQANRESMLREASHRFRAKGVDAVGVDEVTAGAGLTHGAFYNHFESKEALAAEVFANAFEESLAGVDVVLGQHPRSARRALRAAFDAYLSSSHRDAPEFGCPSAALVVDAGRRDEDVQSQYLTGLAGYLDRFEALISDLAAQDGRTLTRAHAREQAISAFSQLVGAMVIARAVAQADPALSDEILESNRSTLTKTTASRAT